MEEPKLWYVYTDLTLDDRPYYIGKGDAPRVFKWMVRNRHHTAIAKAHGQNRRIDLITDNEQTAWDEEVRLIALHNTYVGKDHPEGAWGANYTHGGEGASGGPGRPHPHSQVTRDKIRKSLTGKKLSASHASNISKSHKGIKYPNRKQRTKATPETIEKCKLAQRLCWQKRREQATLAACTPETGGV